VTKYANAGSLSYTYLHMKIAVILV